MDIATRLPALSVGIIVAVSLASGPAGVFDFTTDNPCDEDVFPGDGNANIEVLSTPDTATLTKSRFGSEVYKLEIAPARVDVQDPDGRPILTYKLRIYALDTIIGTSSFLSPCTTGERDLPLQSGRIAPEKVTAEEYSGTLVIIYRGTENGESVQREIMAKNVTVEVSG